MPLLSFLTDADFQGLCLLMIALSLVVLAGHGILHHH